jgi:hypothetical protein
MNRKLLLAVIVIVCVAALVIFIRSRGRISKGIYDRTGRRIAERLTPKQREKYDEELTYTLDKFWSCYEGGIISQNDLTDVVERMKRLERKESLEDMDIFDFIGYVSRIYTDAMLKHHEREEEP